jgi:hypothetical protein
MRKNPDQNGKIIWRKSNHDRLQKTMGTYTTVGLTAILFGVTL